MPVDHKKTLDQVVKAAKKMLPEKREADKILREIERQERAERRESPSITNGEIEPEE